MAPCTLYISVFIHMWKNADWINPLAPNTSCTGEAQNKSSWTDMSWVMTLNAMISYGSAAKRRYWYSLSHGCTLCKRAKQYHFLQKLTQDLLLFWNWQGTKGKQNDNLAQEKYLLIRRHKSMPRLGSIFNFRVLNLKGHGQLNSQTNLDSPGENVALADYCIDA